MKYQLTVSSDDPNDLARVLAMIGAGAPVAAAAPSPIPGAPVPPMPPVPGPGGDAGEDDGGTPDPNAPAVDSTGLPWDERIHSSSRKTANDGTWNKRRGGPKGAEYAAIEAELRARGAAPIPVPAPQPMPVPVPMPQPIAAPVPVPVPPMPNPVEQPQPAPVPVPVPVPYVPPVAQPIEAPAPVATPTDFHSFMAEVSARSGQQAADGLPKLHADYLATLVQRINQACQSQLTSIMDLAQRTDLIPYTIQTIQYDGRW